jgi:hypothetical protein
MILKPVSNCDFCGAPIYGPEQVESSGYDAVTGRGTQPAVQVSFTCECRLFFQRESQARVDNCNAHTECVKSGEGWKGNGEE